MKVMILFFVLIVFLPLVSSTPPDVPVLLYGKVIYDNRLPAAGIGVRAIWIDKNGDINTRVTRTINVNEASILEKPDLLGVYKFEIYDVSDNSKIKIESGKKSNIIDPIYGVQTKVPDIIIDLPKLNNTADYNITQNSNILSSIIEYIANLMGINNNKAQEEIDKYLTNSTKDINKNNGSIDDLGSKYDNEGFTNLTDEEIDELNKTLDIANRDGQESNDPQKDNAMEYENNGSKINVSLYTINNQDPTPVTIFKKFYENNIKLNYLLYSIFILMMTLILFFVFIMIKTFKSKDRNIGIVNISLSKVNSLESKSIMTKKENYLSINNNVLDAIEVFSSNNISIIPVLSETKNISGIVSKKDLLLAIESPDYRFLENTKISTIMRKKYISCRKDQELGDIYTLMIQKKVNEIIVQENGIFYGTIDFFNILNVFNNIDFTIDNPPTLREASNPDVTTIDYKMPLEDIRRKLLDENTEYAIVMKKGIPIGIVTLKDMIIAIEKNMNFKNNYAEHIMSGNLVSMTPGTSVYDAFKIMLERRFNQIPLIMIDKTSGIVNVKYLVKMYYEYINELNSRLRKNPFNAVKIIDDK